MHGDNDPRMYVQVMALVRDRVNDGDYLPGTPIPPLAELAGDVGCNRRTAAKGLQLLHEEGLLVRYPGLGYYVAAGRQAPALVLAFHMAACSDDVSRRRE